MLFKVSFKETEKNPSRMVVKKGRTTIVTLKGVVQLPKFWANIPQEIFDWVYWQNKVELYEHMAEGKLYIFSEGEAKCHEEDKYDSLLGERLAEARAKYCIYKFFFDFTDKLYNYYNQILFGEDGVVDSGKGSCLAQDVKKYEGLCIREAHHIGELLKDKENG